MLNRIPRLTSSQVSRREFLKLGGLAAAGVAVAGCPAPEDPAPPPVVDPDVVPRLAYQGDLEFWDWDHDPRVIYFEEVLIPEWEAQSPGINLRYLPLPWDDIEVRILTQVTARTGPPMSNIHYFWHYELLRAGVLTPFPEEMHDWDKFISTPFFAHEGRIYTFNSNWWATLLHYNVEMLEEEGITIDAENPLSWDDFLRMADQLTRREADGTIVRAGLSYNDYWVWEWMWHDLIYQQGGWVWSEDGTQANWDSEEGVEALRFIGDIYHRWHLDDPEGLPAGHAFGTEMSAFYINQGYAIPGIELNNPDIVGKWGAAVLPTFTGRPEPAWGLQIPEGGFNVFNYADVDAQEACFDFIEYLMGRDWANAVEFNQATGLWAPPDNPELFDDPAVAGNPAIHTQAVTLPYRVFYGERPLEAETHWRDMFSKVILDREDPGVALNEATESMNRVMREADREFFFTERRYQPPS